MKAVALSVEQAHTIISTKSSDSKRRGRINITLKESVTYRKQQTENIIYFKTSYYQSTQEE